MLLGNVPPRTISRKAEGVQIFVKSAGHNYQGKASANILFCERNTYLLLNKIVNYALN